jgi:hypothetical protein
VNVQRQEPAMFGIAVDMHIGVLSSENRTETEMAEMEVISGINEGTEFVAAGGAYDNLRSSSTP